MKYKVKKLREINSPFNICSCNVNNGSFDIIKCILDVSTDILTSGRHSIHIIFIILY